MRLVAITTGLVVLIDQLTKWLVRQAYPLPGDGVTLIAGLFDLRYVRNAGAAWGILQGRSLLLIAFSVVALILLLTGYRRPLLKLPGGGVTLGLLCGGIVGNLIDRVRFGYVIDFLDFYLGRSHFPAFNVADAAICAGVGLYIVTQHLADRRPRNSDPLNPTT
jgi:signal peptidase II